MILIISFPQMPRLEDLISNLTAMSEDTLFTCIGQIRKDRQITKAPDRASPSRKEGKVEKVKKAISHLSREEKEELQRTIKILEG